MSRRDGEDSKVRGKAYRWNGGVEMKSVVFHQNERARQARRRRPGQMRMKDFCLVFKFHKQ